jgi:predicted metallo-beta-lactamase superfamily hydrolase
MEKGYLVKFGKPVGESDSIVHSEKGDRIGHVLEMTWQGYARVFFYGDAKGLQYLVHPESLVVIHKPDYS